MQWETVIGLEIHVQLSTRSKLFSGASTEFGAAPNTQACAVDIGLPGVLPVVNSAVYRKAVAFGLGINAEIGLYSVFDRKNYFYPDLPKGYQITQLDYPIVIGGAVDIDAGEGQKRINITRAHLEEDAGKSVHEEFHNRTGIDLNRAGTPLLEIVSEPELSNAEEAVTYARKIHQLVCYLDVSDGNMAEGSFRCDANVSVRPVGQLEMGTRTETKNVNSFRFLERAINYEVDRQIQVLESGRSVIQETRLYDPDRDETRPMRSKETATDYRYFPEPDLLPVRLHPSFIEEVRSELPELPEVRVQRYINSWQLSATDAAVLTGSRDIADYFEEVCSISDSPRLANNWVRVELLGQLNKGAIEISESPVSPLQLGELLRRVADETVSGKIAKEIFEAMWHGEGSADEIIEARGLKQVTDSSSIERIVDDVLAANPDQSDDFKAGKEKILGFLVGQVMKASQGKANPQQVNELIRSKLAP